MSLNALPRDLQLAIIKKFDMDTRIKTTTQTFRAQRTTTNDTTCVSETGFIEQDTLMAFGVLHHCIEDARVKKVAKKSFLSRLA